MAEVMAERRKTDPVTVATVSLKECMGTQGVAMNSPGQPLYHVSHSTSLFCSGYFEIWSHFMPGWPGPHPPICASQSSWDDRCISPRSTVG
jgi:hypothetical protein